MTGVEEAIPFLAAAFGGAAVSSAFAPKAPAIAPPKPMPVISDAQQQEARRQALAGQQARRGRTSTILTGDDTKLGG